MQNDTPQTMIESRATVTRRVTKMRCCTLFRSLGNEPGRIHVHLLGKLKLRLDGDVSLTLLRCVMSGPSRADKPDQSGCLQRGQVAFGGSGRTVEPFDDLPNLELYTLLHLGDRPTLAFIQTAGR